MFLDQEMDSLARIDQCSPPSQLLFTTTPEEAYRRSEVVFSHFQVPAESDYQAELNRTPYTTEANFLNQLRPYLDPTAQFGRLFTETSTSLQSFRDRDSKQINEYGIRKALRSTPRHPLRGLRVALDPGHMGGDLWDERTGKFVSDGTKKVSEGLIALQTALLLERQLVALGAEVFITHRTLAPVTSVSYDSLPIEFYAKRELRARSHESWFTNLINAAGNDDDLRREFTSSSAVSRLFSERMRVDYFAQREDLYARNRAMAAFQPHLTLVIHYDANIRTPDPSVVNRTLAYIPGGFEATEFATSEARAHFISHLAQGQQWQDSANLATSVVNQISRQLSVALPNSYSGSVPIAPGVFARNLALTRLVTYAPIVYLECLFYGARSEFNRLTVHDGGTLTIGGRAYGYSSRIEKVAAAIADGIVDFTN